MQKTAVQQLIDFVNHDDFKYLYPEVKKSWFILFLAKEREVIEEAFKSGEHNAVVKERHDYDKSDYDYSNANEYFEFITK